MPSKLKIDYLELPARDLDQTQTFYQNTFGWKFTDYGPEYRAFNDSNLNGGFYKSTLCSSTHNGAALLVLYTFQLENILQRVKDNGGEIAKDIFSFPGGRRFHFTDPNGNELAVWSDR